MTTTTEKAASVNRSWSIVSTAKCRSTRISLFDSRTIILENVMSCNLDMLIHLGGETPQKVKLSGVPCFLIDAFGWLEKNNCLTIEGLFRREGNAGRMKDGVVDIWKLFHGLCEIPPECTVHDVCNLIKRFFREIKSPIFADGENKILNFAESCKGRVLVESIFTVIERLPSSHASTIAYLMKQLKGISDLASQNLMTAENLAMVFGPSLFRQSEPENKKKNAGQIDAMNSALRRNNLQVMVVKLLIQTSDFLGIQRGESPTKTVPKVSQKESAQKNAKSCAEEFSKHALLRNSTSSVRPSSISKFRSGCMKTIGEDENEVQFLKKAPSGFHHSANVIQKECAQDDAKVAGGGYLKPALDRNPSSFIRPSSIPRPRSSYKKTIGDDENDAPSTNTALSGFQSSNVSQKEYAQDNVKTSAVEFAKPALLRNSTSFARPSSISKSRSGCMKTIEEDEKDIQFVKEVPSGFHHSASLARHITSSATSGGLLSPRTAPNFAALPMSNRPSLAYFQKNNRGFVRQRVSQFGELAAANEKEEWIDRNNKMDT